MSSAKPHIGMVSWDFDPPIGGMGSHVRSLVESLRSDGWPVSVLSQKDIRIPGRNIGFSIALMFVLRRWIKRQGIDILHVHTGPGGVLLFRSVPVPLVVTANHTYHQQAQLPRQRWKCFLFPWERRTYRLAHRVVCISADTEEILCKEYAIPRSVLSVIPCGFSLPKLPADAEHIRRSLAVVFVGRPDVRKGWGVLFRAWERVHAVLPEAILHVVGFSGVSRPAVRFHGRLSAAELRSLVMDSRCVVCPSLFEGFGLSAAEAIASGTPVVATNVAGLRSIIRNEQTGLLSPVEPTAFADRILRVLTDDSLWEHLRRGGLADRHRFDSSLERDAYASLYRALY